METTPRRFSLTIRRDADYDGLMALLALQPAELPGETVSRIYEIRYIPEKEAAVPEDLQILVIGDEVYCLRRAADGSEKSYLAGCSADGFRAQIWQFDSSEEEAVTGEDSLLSTLLGLKARTADTPEAPPKAAELPVDQVPRPESVS